MLLRSCARCRKSRVGSSELPSTKCSSSRHLLAFPYSAEKPYRLVEWAKPNDGCGADEKAFTIQGVTTQAAVLQHIAGMTDECLFCLVPVENQCPGGILNGLCYSAARAGDDFATTSDSGATG